MQSWWFYAMSMIVAVACGGSTSGETARGTNTGEGGTPGATTGGTAGTGVVGGSGVGAGGVGAGGFGTGGIGTGGIGTGGVDASVGAGGADLGTGGYFPVPGCCPDGCTEPCSRGTWRTCGVAPTDSQWIIQVCRCDGTGWDAVEVIYGQGSVVFGSGGSCSIDPPKDAGNDHSLDSGAADSGNGD